MRPLSQAVRAEIAAPAGYEPAPALREPIAGRADLIRRIARAEGGSPSALAFLHELQVAHAPTLHVRYRLDIAGEEKESAPARPAAALDREAGILYVGGDPHSPPWLAIAREIAGALAGRKPAGGLVLAIKEVLAAATDEAAREMVDQLGYPG